ncbi:MAG: carboxypeptidase-like regulatory domain-containing protein [Gemmatimonadota bacterium]
MLARLAVLMLLVTPACVWGQAGDAELRGRVIDASNRTPIEGASVSVTPLPAGVIGGRGGGASLIGSMSTTTDRTGAYRVGPFAAGRYRLTVERIGYEPAVAEVELAAGAPRLTMTLQVAPIELEPVDVTTRGSSVAADVVAPVGVSEVTSFDVRPALGLGPDSWVVDRRRVRAVTTGGEPDILRALQRTPGVSGRDEYSAELWTRGSGWSGTRVLLDDLPLLGPFMWGAALTALPTAAFGSAILHTGPHGVAREGGAAGLVELGTRSAASEPGFHGSAEFGIGTMSAVGEARSEGGRLGLLLSGRRSWFDRVWNTFVDDGFDPEGPFSYVASGRLVRGDLAVDERTTLVASHYRARDVLDENAAAVLTAASGSWGSQVDQLAVTRTIGAREVRLVVGRSRTSGSLRPEPLDPMRLTDPSTVIPRVGSFQAEVKSLVLDARPVSDPSEWSGGFFVTEESVAGEGVASTRPLAETAGAAISGGRLTRIGSWASVRLEPVEALELRLGLRAALLDIDRGYDLDLGPHVQATARLPRATRLTGAWRRTHQHMQQVASAGSRFLGGQTFGHAWLVRGQGPTRVSDLVSVGVESPLRPGLWGVATLWSRDSDGVAIVDPTPGSRSAYPVPWASAQERASGFDVGVRDARGPVTGHAYYSWTSATLESAGRRVPSPHARTHALDASLRWRASNRVSAHGALRAQSGVATTRTVEVSCPSRERCVGVPVVERGPWGALDSPGFSSLDLSVDVVGRRGGVDWGLSIQLLNVLGTGDFGAYRETLCEPGQAAACAAGRSGEDVHQGLLPARLPMAHLRIGF